MKRFGVSFLMLLVGAGMMLNSCVENDVDFIRDDSNVLHFGVSSATVSTRAADAAEEDIAEQADSVCWTLMEVEGDEEFSKPLYVTMVSEQRKAVKGDDYASEDAETRGAPATTDTFASLYGERGFGLFAYVYAPGEWNENSTTSEYIHNQSVKYMSSYWALSAGDSTTQYYWPGANYNVRFYAYAPYAGVYYDDIIKVQSTAYEGIPKIDITVSKINRAASGNEEMTLHPDLLIAKSGEVPGNKNAKQHLEFKHVFSAINFKVGAKFEEGTIKKIEFQNVLRSGTLNLESQTWENIDEANPATISLTKDIAISGDAGQQVLVEDDYFMMLPQTLPADAKLVITFVDSNGREHTLKSSIGQQDLKWEMSYLYTFTISGTQTPQDEYIFEVTAPSETTADYLGDVLTEGTVKSYLTHTNAFGIETHKEAVPWTTEYSTDGGRNWKTTLPEFFSSFTEGAAGKVEATDKYEGTIAPITPDDPKNPFGNNIENRPVNSGTTNLYTSNGNTTANCYVVNAAGTYIFPLVYGNAINDGGINTSAYNPKGKETDEYYATFVDHSGAKISSPYIYPEKLDSAKLLWTDAPNLIRDVELSTASETMSVAGTNVRYITFTVPKEHLAPGNAVIAILDPAGVIMWSWHIWVTTWNGTSVSVTSNSKTFNFSDTILGYCPARDATWNARDVMVRFKQTGSGKVSSTYTFEQDGFDLQYSEGNMPYYQWGRKDPLLMYNYITDPTTGTATSGSEKICFGTDKKTGILKVWNGNSGKYVDFPYSGYFKVEGKMGSARDNGVNMSESIQNPCTFYPRSLTVDTTGGYEFDWCNKMGYNRWDAANSGNITDPANKRAIVKTIYDPCPPGWCVPPVGAFYGFTSSGGATEVTSPYTTMTNVLDNGDITPAFQIKANGGNDVTLPITGDRNRYFASPWYTDLQSRTVELWTATPSSTTATNNTAYFVSSIARKSDYKKLYSSLSSGVLAKSSGFAVLPVKE